jgi:hypothetical protein
MLNLPSCMDIFKNKSTWNKLLAMSRMTLSLCFLKKYFYGTMQAPRSWYEKMDNFLIATRFSRFHSDHNVYTKKVGIHLIILVLYVDDLILNGSDSKLLNHVKTNLKKKFKMTDLGFLHYFLGPQVLQTNEGIFFSPI